MEVQGSEFRSTWNTSGCGMVARANGAHRLHDYVSNLEAINTYLFHIGFEGVPLNQFGLMRYLTIVKVLSKWGIAFMLHGMGLIGLDRNFSQSIIYAKVFEADYVCWSLGTPVVQAVKMIGGGSSINIEMDDGGYEMGVSEIESAS
ncbi:hypothetical protein L2E82_01194 [Cichorium intybus]|uniref:Uncharacterized protein n=1 Tax=Cichorium intybus TaxID=13427 RepID=A0ACB9GZG8_CICIN|nr:hypothetical protein L2E82_01194 [Cichorium intybus]